MKVAKTKFPEYHDKKTRKDLKNTKNNKRNWKNEFFQKLRLWALKKFSGKFVFVQRLRIAQYQLKITRKRRIIRELKRQMIRKTATQRMSTKALKNKRNTWLGTRI